MIVSILWWIYVMYNFAILLSTFAVLLIEEQITLSEYQQVRIFYRMFALLIWFGIIVLMADVFPLVAIVISIFLFEYFTLGRLMDT